MMYEVMDVNLLLILRLILTWKRWAVKTSSIVHRQTLRHEKHLRCVHDIKQSGSCAMSDSSDGIFLFELNELKHYMTLLTLVLMLRQVFITVLLHSATPEM